MQVGEASASFTIDAPVDATATITTDRAQYVPDATVHITGRVTFQSAGGAGETGEAAIRVLDAGGQVRFEMVRTLAFGTTADVLADWAATGAYRPRPSVATLANAMDVGAPSNFERLAASCA